MNSLRFTTVCAVMWLALPAFGADDVGNYYVGGGAGGVRCPKFVATMEKARTHGVDTLGYVHETSGFVMYLLGFQTGYNMSTPDTFDIFPGTDGDYPLLSWVENYCRANPASNFGRGVTELAQAIYAKRQRSGSEK